MIDRCTWEPAAEITDEWEKISTEDTSLKKKKMKHNQKMQIFLELLRMSARVSQLWEKSSVETFLLRMKNYNS